MRGRGEHEERPGCQFDERDEKERGTSAGPGSNWSPEPRGRSWAVSPAHALAHRHPALSPLRPSHAAPPHPAAHSHDAAPAAAHKHQQPPAAVTQHQRANVSQTAAPSPDPEVRLQERLSASPGQFLLPSDGATFLYAFVS